MTMVERHDGSRYPDGDADDAVLADFPESDSAKCVGYAYERTVGDLIVMALTGQDPDEFDGVSGSPDDWPSFDNAVLLRAAADLRVLSVAMHGEPTDGYPFEDELTLDEAKTAVRALQRRMEAGAELATRLRRARWGHPAFGGGEAFLERRAESLKARSAEQTDSEAAE
jgi:hypothetical protein